MNKFVISGGAHSGKTTIVNELRKMGYNVLPETARMVIREQKSIPNGMSPEKELYELEVEIIKKQLMLESKISDEIVFLDRSIIDTLGYLKIINKEPPLELMPFFNKKRYEKVFFLEMLPDYETDEERWEDEERARRIHNIIRSIYLEKGYELIDVPVMSVQDRVNFIKEEVGL